MVNLRLFLTMLAAVLLLAAVIAPRIGVADGAGPASPAQRACLF